MTLPFIATSSTVNAVNVPSEVTFPCAAVCNVPVTSPVKFPVTLVVVRTPVLGL
jgi:hypothetical protein